MSLTKELFVTLAFICLTILAVQAQPPRGEGGRRGGDPAERANRQSERMIKSLDLSAAQGEKIKSVNLEYAEKMQTIRTQARKEDTDREEMREKMKALRVEQKTALKKYLTAEQLEKWEQLQKERPQQGKREGRRGKGKKEKSNG